MTAILKTNTPAELYQQQQRAELMIAAGEFAVAVKTIIDHNELEAVEDDAGRGPLNDRTIDGLLGGLKVIGNLLSDEGHALKAQLEKAAQQQVSARGAKRPAA